MTSSKSVQIYRKSRSGCITCKIRKVKCDEKHPVCLRCSSTGRKCDGYPAPVDTRNIVGYLIIQHVTEYCLPIDEKRALFYFQHVTAPSLVNLDSAAFWSRTTLQICHQEDALKHIIIAISLADEQRLSQVDLPKEKSRHMHHYGKALKLLSSQPRTEIWSIVMASLLLCVYEDLQFRDFSALQHITSGRDILRNTDQANSFESGMSYPSSNAVLVELVPIFAKLERHTWEFDLETLNSRGSLPLDDLCERERDSYYDEPWPMDVDRMTPSPTIFARTSAFESLDHANRWLYALRPRCIASREMDQPPATRFHMVPVITYQLNIWLESLHVFVRLASPSLSAEDFGAISILRTFQLCLHILSQTFPFHSEILFDKHAHLLEHVIQKLPYYFDRTAIDLTPALWLGATKSRNPAYRRQAVCMLRRTDQKPGACVGRGEILARAAEKIIEIEEMDLDTVLSCSDIPVTNRVRVFGLKLLHGREQLVISFRRAPHNETTVLDIATVDLEDMALNRETDMQLEAALSFDWMALQP